MQTLFITKYLAGNIDELRKECYILVFPYVTTLLLMIIDLIAGIAKAKQLGEYCTSTGLRRSIAKFKEYYSSLLTASFVDLLLSIIPVYGLPWLTFIVGVYIAIVEGLSIREKAADKERRRANNDIRAILTILENKDNPSKGFAEIIQRELNERDASKKE